MSYDSVNPYNGEHLKTFEGFTNPQLEAALASADACFKTWKRKSYAERAVIVAKAAELMHAQVDHFAKLATLEMGKRIDEARGEVNFSGNILAYYAKNAAKFLAPEKLNPVHGEAHMESSLIGIIFCVEHWNFPYYQLARVAGP
ncbi:MAG: aldehyde dehydrogenase family protein, partial [Nevskia sp.]|nr:aldehyde dehydrogenase family protein [Nevskia sp.]